MTGSNSVNDRRKMYIHLLHIRTSAVFAIYALVYTSISLEEIFLKNVLNPLKKHSVARIKTENIERFHPKVSGRSGNDSTDIRALKKKNRESTADISMHPILCFHESPKFSRRVFFSAKKSAYVKGSISFPFLKSFASLNVSSAPCIVLSKFIVQIFC